MKNQDNTSNASFLRWMNPIIIALKQLGGSGKPQEVRAVIAKNEKLSEAELTETRGKNGVNKFVNEVAFARSYLVRYGYIDNSQYGQWILTEDGKSAEITDELAAQIFKYGIADAKEKRNKEANYDWVNFYSEFADVLLKYKENRFDLINNIKKVYTLANLKLPKLEMDENIDDIDPFTVFGLFNKGISDSNKIRILKALSQVFFLKSEVPTSFDGIPVVNNMKATFYAFRDVRGKDDINNLWEVFDNAIKYSEKLSDLHKKNLIDCFDKVRKQKCIRWNITMALYWIRPNVFISLDAKNRDFLNNVDNMPHYFTTIFADINKGVPNGANYIFMCEQARNALKKSEYEYHNFPELSYYAWKNSVDDNNDDLNLETLDSDVNETAYWIYSPGENACMWDEFRTQGIMGIGWDDLGCSIKEFSSKEEIKEQLRRVYDPNYSYKYHAHCLWQFANEMKVGDVVFVKKGLHKIIGKGVVTSDYIYDNSRNSYFNIRKVDWQNVGEWEHPGNAVTKTLTNISSYNDYVEKLLNIFDETEVEPIEPKEIKYPTYSKDDFLDEVYMDETVYNTLVELIDTKYNVILQGAPGVGKTFTAKRLAYSIMGEKDTSRVAMIQFHQSYSYEDFIQGYRPVKDGFELENGVFYKFCKEAAEDNERLYFFIIDEINRGNLSKILGELMMLIEKDKRGEKIKLLYSNEWFTVPKNLRIIGMMNTADRSLALMDYALRRRFAFFDFSPAFNNDNFKGYIAEKNNEKLDKLIAMVNSLNVTISNDESLGDGFRIGHSYFCTKKEITYNWLNSVIEYELIPLIKEYWFDEPSKVRDWSAKLRSTIK